jgi:hypothetical protein
MATRRAGRARERRRKGALRGVDGGARVLGVGEAHAAVTCPVAGLKSSNSSLPRDERAVDIDGVDDL